MIRFLVIMGVTLGCLLTNVRCGQAQAGGFDPSVAGAGLNLGNLGMGLGGGEAIPGAILLKIKGEVLCTACTLEEKGVDPLPGDLYQFSRDNTHLVIRITSAAPEIAWEMVEGHKFFLFPGEDATQLQHLLHQSRAGKHVEIIGGVAPALGSFIPLNVQVK